MTEAGVCIRCACSVWREEITEWPEAVRMFWADHHVCRECQEAMVTS